MNQKKEKNEYFDEQILDWINSVKRTRQKEKFEQALSLENLMEKVPNQEINIDENEVIKFQFQKLYEGKIQLFLPCDFAQVHDDKNTRQVYLFENRATTSKFDVQKTNKPLENAKYDIEKCLEELAIQIQETLGQTSLITRETGCIDNTWYGYLDYSIVSSNQTRHLLMCVTAFKSLQLIITLDSNYEDIPVNRPIFKAITHTMKLENNQITATASSCE